jgi:PKD repeat protein
MKKQGFIPLVFIILLSGTGCYKSKSVPAADFSYTNDTIPHSIRFRNLSLNATSYEWSFGDNTTSETTNPVHLYPDTGTYTVLLKAFSDGKAEWAQKSQKIKVK